MSMLTKKDPHESYSEYQERLMQEAQSLSYFPPAKE